MPKKNLKKKSMAKNFEDPAPVLEEPCGTEQSAVMDDSEAPPELAPEETCETIELVDGWESPLEPASEEPYEATELAVEEEVCPPAVEEAKDAEASPESICEVVEHAVIEQPDDDDGCQIR
ncbi:hypothetical protein EIK77_004969 [Talaromyces pinophilus]|nr:hypothetical protein EIK77_004969 [Talaromyces pinophilus]